MNSTTHRVGCLWWFVSFYAPPKNTHFYQSIYSSVFVAHSLVWFSNMFLLFLNIWMRFQGTTWTVFFAVSLLLPQNDQFPYTSKHTKGTHGYRRRRAKNLVTFHSWVSKTRVNPLQKFTLHREDVGTLEKEYPSSLILPHVLKITPVYIYRDR